jgi:hypothetical protein
VLSKIMPDGAANNADRSLAGFWPISLSVPTPSPAVFRYLLSIKVSIARVFRN